MKKVSIIVPVYNAAAYLPACLDSILKQTYPKLELIIINDGSTDASLQIAARYQQQDTRVYVHDKPNSGPGSARNKGLDMATGEFVQFVDADDRLHVNATAQLMQQMEGNTDLVLCTYEKDGQTKKLPIRAGIYSKRALLEQLGNLYAATMLPSPCNKLYRLSIIQTYGLQFPEHTSYGEDLLFNLAYLAHCHSIYCLDQPLYCYQTQPESLTNSAIPDLFGQQKKLQHALRDFLQKEDCLSIDNVRALQHTFAKDSLYAATNLFHHDNRSRNKRDILKQMMQDLYIYQNNAFMPSSIQERLWQHFIRQQAYTRATLFFRTKAWLKGRFS